MQLKENTHTEVCFTKFLIYKFFLNHTSVWVFYRKFAAYFFRTPFTKNNSGWLLLIILSTSFHDNHRIKVSDFGKKIFKQFGKLIAVIRNQIQ